MVAEVNRFLRGWAGYFRYGNSAAHFDRMRTFAVQRLARYVGYRYQGRRFKHGWYQVVHASPDQLGLLSLDGIIGAPRANKPWREKPALRLEAGTGCDRRGCRGCAVNA